MYFVGGLVLTLGPSELIRTATQRPDSTPVDVVFLVAGLVAVGFAVWVFLNRKKEAKIPDVSMHPGSALALGAGMTAVDLPTAFPYFAAIVAIIGEGLTAPAEIGALLLFNVAYIVPIVVIAVAAAVLGDRAAAFLEKVRVFVTRWSPMLLSLLSLVVGLALIFSGIDGLAT